MESIFNYKEDKRKNFIYSYYKISLYGKYYHLRYKARNCSGTPKFIIKSEDIIIMQKCFIDYDRQNYIIKSKNKEKITKIADTKEEMKDCQ